MGNPPSYESCRKIAGFLSIANGNLQPIGVNWLRGFLARNAEVRSLRGKRLDFQRLNGALTHAIQAFFKLLTIPALAKIPPENRWNMDETGLAIGL